MPIRPDREYRKIDIRNIAAMEEEGRMIVRGYATTFEQPYVLWEAPGFILREVVDLHAFDDTDMADVIMQYDHQGRVFARTRNGTLQVQPDDHGLLIVADLGGTTIGRQLYEEIRGGYTDRMSFGFTIEADEETRETDPEGRENILSRITRIKKLYDVSAVSIPANDATEISARSRSEGFIARIQQERLAKAERERKQKLLKLKMEVWKNDLR